MCEYDGFIAFIDPRSYNGETIIKRECLILFNLKKKNQKKRKYIGWSEEIVQT